MSCSIFIYSTLNRSLAWDYLNWFKESINIIEPWQSFPSSLLLLCYLVFCIFPHTLSLIHLFLMLIKADLALNVWKYLLAYLLAGWWDNDPATSFSSWPGHHTRGTSEEEEMASGLLAFIHGWSSPTSDCRSFVSRIHLNLLLDLPG